MVCEPLEPLVQSNARLMWLDWTSAGLLRSMLTNMQLTGTSRGMCTPLLVEMQNTKLIGSLYSIVTKNADLWLSVLRLSSPSNKEHTVGLIGLSWMTCGIFAGSVNA